MSKAFEILERVQQERELFRVSPITRKVSDSARPANGLSTSDLAVSVQEEVRRLVRSLFLVADDDVRHVPRRVVFCGIDEADGSSLLCARVGRSLAEQVHSRVCVLEADVHSTALRALFDLAPVENSVLPSSESKEKFSHITDNLWFASCDLLTMDSPIQGPDQLQTALIELSTEFAHVIIHAPPIGLYHDAGRLAQMADGVVLVLEANYTRRVAARKAKLVLESSNARVLGTVLNNRTFPIPKRIYHLL